jgi:hypothetical protein
MGVTSLTFVDFFRRPPGRAIDTWAYTVHGQALARGETPPFDELLTTPKPLASFLATITSPLPPEWGLGIVTTLAVAALLIGLYIAGDRWAGPAGAVLSVVAFMAVGRMAEAINGALIDVITPACLVWAVLTRGYVRVALIVVAGLLHPFVWPIAAVAGWQTARTGDRDRRRWIRVAAVSVSAPTLWLLADLVVAGDALATPHWIFDYREELLGDGGPSPGGWFEQIDNLGRIFAPDPAALVVTVVGIVGLVLIARRSRAEADPDPLPLAIATVWLVFLMLYVGLGSTMQQRYLLPSQAMLAIGVGKAGSMLATRWTVLRGEGARVAGAVLAVAIVATFLWTDDLDGARASAALRHQSIESSRAAIEAGLRCGRVGFTGTRFTAGIVGEVAARLSADLERFGTVETNEQMKLVGVDGYAAIFRLHQAAGSLPWRPIFQTDLGRVAYAPGCEPPPGLEVFKG